MRIVCGTLRPLTCEERKVYKSQGYCWVVTEAFEYENDGKKIIVPKGFLTDGASGGPDYGCSWLFHDWLYANHKFHDSSEDCTRQDADFVMTCILDNERLSFYLRFFNIISYYDILWCFSRAWNKSGQRGPQFLELADIVDNVQ